MDAATVSLLGDLLYELVNESGQFGSDDEESRVRSALLAVARDLIPEAASLTEIADEVPGTWNHDFVLAAA